MLRFVSRFFALSIFGSMLAACTQVVTQAEPVCGPSENIAACFFSVATPQGDGDVLAYIETLQDAIDLPVKELRAKRYKPNQDSFEEQIRSLFAGKVRKEDGEWIDSGSLGFMEALKQPEAAAILKKILSDLKEPVANLFSDSPCAPSENIALCFFKKANLQGDSDPKPLFEALKDALNLPLAELRAKRYEDFMGKPDQWTFEKVIGSFFTGMPRNKNGELIDSRTEGFIEATKQPEAVPVIKKLLTGLEEYVREHKSTEKSVQ